MAMGPMPALASSLALCPLQCIRPDNSVEHRDVDGNVFVTADFLPLDRPARIGVTSGASTPDSVVQECIESIMLVKKLAAGAAASAAAEPEEEAPEEPASEPAAPAEIAPPEGYEWGVSL